MRPSRLSALFAALCLVLVASCVDGGVPMAPDGLTGGAVLPISAAALPQAVDGVPPAINRIRAVARVVPGGTVVGSAVLDVNPSADSWAVEIKIDLGGFPSTTVEVTFELINVGPTGQETVQFSGKSEPVVVRAGSDNEPVTLPLVRGGLGNLKVTGVQITEPIASILEGATMTVAATVTTTDPSVTTEVFWTSLDPIATVTGNVVTGVLPGVARIVATAGSKSDTAQLTILQRPAAVRVSPDSQAVVGNGVSVTLSAVVVDARGATIAGQPVLWRTLTPAVLEDQGSGRFRSVAPGRGVAEARAAADTTLKGTGVVRVTRPATDISVTKTVAAPTVFENEVATFTITARNNSETTASGVRVTDQLPAGLTLASSSASAGSFADGTWSIGDLAPGVSATLQIGARAAAGTVGRALTNTARLQPLIDQQDSNADNDAASAVVTVARRTSDISVTKTVANASVAEGDTAVFTITVHNNGPFDASGVVVADSLPPEMAYASHQNSAGSFQSGTRLWDVGGIPVGGTQTLTLRAVVRANSTTLRNRVRVMSISNADDPQRGNDTASAAVVVGQPVSDVAVTKTANRSTANPGDTVKFTVTITNVSGITATGVIVVDTIKAPYKLVSVTTTGGAVADTAARQIRVASLARGTAATAIYTVKIDPAAGGGTSSNTAKKTASLPNDPNGGNDAATASVVIGTPTPRLDLQVTKSVSNAAPFEHDTIVYTITVRNNGPVAATSVQLVDTISDFLTPVSSGAMTMNAGSVAFSGSVGTWSIPSIAAGVTDTLRLKGTVDGGAAGQTIPNRVWLSAVAQTDTLSTNNMGSATMTVGAAANRLDLRVLKTVDKPAPFEKDTVTYTITVKNNGPIAATGVQLVDTLSDDLTPLPSAPWSMNAGSISISGSVGTWSIPSIPAGVTDTLRIKVTVAVGAAGHTIANRAHLAALTQTDTVPSNNQATVSATIGVHAAPTHLLFRTIGNTQLIAKSYAAPNASRPHLSDSANVLSGTTGLTVTTDSVTTPLGGKVDFESNGDFTYYPPVGLAGMTDTVRFAYGGTSSGSARLDLVIDTTLVWFVDNADVPPPSAPPLPSVITPPGNHTGASWAPFSYLSNSAQPNAQTTSTDGDVIYLNTGNQSYDGPINLKTGQSLIGEGTGLTLSVNGVSRVIEAAGVRPTVYYDDGNAIELARNNLIKGVLVKAASYGIHGSDQANLTIDNVEITNAYKGLVLEDWSGAQVTGLFVGTVTETAIELAYPTGTITFTHLAIPHHTGYGPAFEHYGGDADVTINLGPTPLRSDSLHGRPVAISNVDAGSVTITGGTIEAHGSQGIRIYDVDAPITISSAVKLFHTYNSPALDIFSGSALIRLTGGLDIDNTGTSSYGIQGLAGSRLEITGLENTIATGTGKAVYLSCGIDCATPATAIGPSGITLKSVSSDGASYGIYISEANTTSPGFFKVLGETGTAGSGGTIKNGTGSSASVFLAYLPRVWLKNMIIEDGYAGAINGSFITDLVLENTEISNNGIEYSSTAMVFYNLLGTSVFNGVTVDHSGGDGIAITNDQQTLSLAIADLDIRGLQNSENTADLLTLLSQNAAVMSVDVESATFHDAQGTAIDAYATGSSAIDLTVMNSQFTNLYGGIETYQQNSADVTYDIRGNAFAQVSNESIEIGSGCQIVDDQCYDPATGDNAGEIASNSYRSGGEDSKAVYIALDGEVQGDITIDGEDMGSGADVSYGHGISTYVSQSANVDLSILNNRLSVIPSAGYELWTQLDSFESPAASLCLDLADNTFEYRNNLLHVERVNYGSFGIVGLGSPGNQTVVRPLFQANNTGLGGQIAVDAIVSILGDYVPCSMGVQ